MKQQLLASLGILVIAASGSSFAAEQEEEKTKPLTPTEIVKPATSADICPANCVVKEKTPQKKAIKKRKVKKNAVIIKPVDLNPVLTDIVVKEEINGIEFTPTPISYKDIKVSMFTKTIDKESTQVGVNLINKNTEAEIDPSTLEHSSNGQKVTLISINSKTFEIKTSELENNKNPYLFQIINKDEDRKTCYTLYVSYKLKNQSETFNEIKYLDQDLNLTDSFPSDCTDKSANKYDSVIQSYNSELINISLNPTKINKDKQIAFSLFSFKEGKGFYPHGLTSIAVNENFSKVYPLTPKQDTRGVQFGIHFEKSVAPGDYTVITNYTSGGKIEVIKTPISISN